MTIPMFDVRSIGLLIFPSPQIIEVPMETSIPHHTSFDALQRFQDGLFAQGIAGNDLAVFREGRPIYRYMTGYRDLEAHLPTTRDTLYRVYSMTKPITAAATLKLWEQGAFCLDEPLCKRMPAFRHMRIETSLPDGTLISRTSESPLRIIDLLTMTAGFDYSIETPRLDALFNVTTGYHTTQDVATALAEQALSFTPGTRWQYGLAFDVLAAYLEIVSGAPFGMLLRNLIFDPLSMPSAGYCHEENPFLCRAYRFNRTNNYVTGPGIPRMLRSPLFEGGGAGLVMTVDDYAKFACMLTGYGKVTGGVRILKKRSVELMTRNHLHGQQLADFIASPMGHPGYGYGFGVRVLVDPKEANSPAGKHAFDWGGALGTYVLMDPLNQLTIIYAQQRPGQWDETIPSTIRDLVYSALQ